jgi:peptidoglycan/xylan/chitin deacetylase (PgdA/CDA1 family)
MAKPVHTVWVCVLFVGLTFAQTPTLRVLPWNDHPAAVSLTFNDARPAQLDVVVPELNKHHLHATFFVIVSKLTRLDDWRRAQAQSHEIGNHSVTHEHPEMLTRASEEIEVEDAKKFLDSNFNSNVVIFAYPYELSSRPLAPHCVVCPREHPIQIRCRADQRQVSKCLGEVP